MAVFGNYKNSTFYLSVVFVCFYFAHLSFNYISYQVNDRILRNVEEKYLLRLDKNIEQTKLLKEHEVKKKVFNILSSYHTGLDSHKLRQTSRVIYQEGKKYGYDPMLLVAVIRTESSFYNWAKSNVGARGLMQLMPFTAREIADETELQWKGKKTLYNPTVNVKMGTYYLDKMENRFGNMQLALEAYNNGPRGLNRMLNKGFLPTRYSNKVFGNYERIKQGSIY